MDDIVTFETGEKASKKDFLDLQAKLLRDAISEGEFLTDLALHCVGGTRQCVKLARQVVCEFVAMLFRREFPNDKVKILLARLLEVMDELFKLFTSKESDADSDDKSKHAFGTHPEYHMSILTEAYHYFETLKFSGRNFFQAGALLTIKGTIGLLEHVKENYGVDRFYTSHITQDELERLFGWIRKSSNYDPNPSPQQFLNRLQKKVTGILLDNDSFGLMNRRAEFELYNSNSQGQKSHKCSS